MARASYQNLSNISLGSPKIVKKKTTVKTPVGSKKTVHQPPVSISPSLATPSRPIRPILRPKYA